MMVLFFSFIFALCLLLPLLNDYIFLSGWLLTLFLFLSLYRVDKMKINVVDICIFVYGLFDFCSIFISYSHYASLDNFINTYIILIFYFICRLVIRNENRNRIILSVSLICTLFPLLYLIPFGMTFENIKFLHLGNYISDFKFILTPFGMSFNLWTTFLIYILLLQSLCILIYRKKAKKPYLKYIFLGFVFTISLLINSFSRGAYICLVIYIIGIFFLLLEAKINKKNKFIYVFMFIAIIGFASCFHFNDVVKTLKMTETISQQRSLDSRYTAIFTGFRLFAENPLWGVGVNNFSYGENFLCDSKDTVTSFSGNILSQLLVERGCVGTIIALSLVISIFYLILSYKKSCSIKSFFLLLFCILTVREFTYPGLLSCISCQLIFFLFVSLCQSYFGTFVFQIELKPRVSIMISIMLILLSGYISYYLYNKHEQITYNKKFVEAIEHNYLFEAEKIENKLGEGTGSNLNRSILYWNLYKKNKQAEYLSKAEKTLLIAIKDSPYDYVLWHNLAKIHELKGDFTQSNRILDSLERKHSKKLLFQLTSMTRNKELNEKVHNLLIRHPTMQQTIYYKTLNYPKNARVIKNNLKSQSKKIMLMNDPILYANYGTLLWQCQDTILSKFFLEKALLQLPNLIEPRYNLSLIESALNNKEKADLYLEQYNFLTHNSKKRINECIDNSYYNYFFYWYGVPTSAKEVIFY